MKYRVDMTEWDCPDLDGAISVPLVSADRRENVLFDVRQGESISRRERTRTEGGGAPHRNPEGEEIDSPHLHLYREGFGDKWAIPVPSEVFGDVTDRWRTAPGLHAILQRR